MEAWLLGKLRLFLEWLTVPMLLVALQLPHASLVYWLSSGLATLGQQALLRLPPVRCLAHLDDAGRCSAASARPPWGRLNWGSAPPGGHQLAVTWVGTRVAEGGSCSAVTTVNRHLASAAGLRWAWRRRPRLTRAGCWIGGRQREATRRSLPMSALKRQRLRTAPSMSGRFSKRHVWFRIATCSTLNIYLIPDFLHAACKCCAGIV